MEDELYYGKYLKYKAKYLELKYGGKKENYVIYMCKSELEMNDITKCTKLREQLIPERIVKSIKESKIGNVIDKNIFVLESNLADFETGLKKKGDFAHRIGKLGKKTVEVAKKGVEVAKQGLSTASSVVSEKVKSVSSKFSSQPSQPKSVGGDPIDLLF